MLTFTGFRTQLFQSLRIERRLNFLVIIEITEHVATFSRTGARVGKQYGIGWFTTLRPTANSARPMIERCISV